MLHEIKNSYDIAQYKVDPQSVFFIMHQYFLYEFDQKSLEKIKHAKCKYIHSKA